MINQDFLETPDNQNKNDYFRWLKNMKNKTSDKIKIIVLLIVLIIISSVFYLYYQTFKKDKTIISTPQITQAPLNELSQNFPQNIPLNSKEKIEQSYDANYPNATAKQSTIVFLSAQTPEQNFNFYKKWGQDNGYEIVNQTDGENLKSLYLRKNNEDINIAIVNDSINISYVRF